MESLHKGTGKARFGRLYGPQRAFIKEGTDLLSMYKRNHGK